MQVLESVPTISVEKTDGCQMYLSKGNNPEIITAKSSEMNVIIPTDDDDYVSCYCPRHLSFNFELSLCTTVMLIMHSLLIGGATDT